MEDSFLARGWGYRFGRLVRWTMQTYPDLAMVARSDGLNESTKQVVICADFVEAKRTVVHGDEYRMTG